MRMMMMMIPEPVGLRSSNLLMVMVVTLDTMSFDDDGILDKKIYAGDDVAWSGDRLRWLW